MNLIKQYNEKELTITVKDNWNDINSTLVIADESVNFKIGE